MSASVVTAILLALAALPARAEDAPPGRSVVVIDICSARADHFGFAGYGRPTTPELDALAKESVVFDQAIAQSSWCLPNYASLFTGHDPEVHGQYLNLPPRRLPAFETTIAQRLRETGLRTAAYSGGVYMTPDWGLDKGFSDFINNYSTTTHLPGTFEQNIPGILEWMKKGKGPFFLYVAVDDLHAPYQSEDPDAFDPGYSGVAHDTDTLSVRFSRAYDGEPLDTADPLNAKLKAFRKDPRALAHLTSHYDAALRGVDRQIGRFVRELKGRGLWDDTLVIVTADHGEMLGEHGLLGHTEGLYEPVLRVPLLIHHPDYAAMNGKHVQALVRRIDLTPTILETAGARFDDLQLQGLSLAPLLRGPGVELRPYAYASSKRNRAELADVLIDERVLRTARWKLHWYDYKDAYELYDLALDPLERHDLAAEQPQVVARMSQLLMKETERARPHAPGLPAGETKPLQTDALHVLRQKG